MILTSAFVVVVPGVVAGGVTVVWAGVKKFFRRYPAALDTANCQSFVQSMLNWPACKEVRIIMTGPLRAATAKESKKSLAFRLNCFDVVIGMM